MSRTEFEQARKAVWEEDGGEGLRSLLAQGLDPDLADPDDGYTLLHAAAMALGEQATGGRVATLLRAGARPDPRARTPYGPGWTPLLLALEEGTAESARALLEGGADPNLRAERGTLPLENAIQRPDLDMVRALVDAGADPCARTSQGASLVEVARFSLRVARGLASEATREARPQWELEVAEGERILAYLEAIERHRPPASSGT